MNLTILAPNLVSSKGKMFFLENLMSIRIHFTKIKQSVNFLSTCLTSPQSLGREVEFLAVEVKMAKCIYLMLVHQAATNTTNSNSINRFPNSVNTVLPKYQGKAVQVSDLIPTWECTNQEGISITPKENKVV